MALVEKIISRGGPGAELGALVAARECGLSTGGHTRARPEDAFVPIVTRYRLTADGCNWAESVLRNAREADGTLIFGPVERWIAVHVRAQRKPFYEAGAYGRPDRLTELCFVDWLRNYAIGTLNVIGPSDKVWERPARRFILEAISELRQSEER